MIEPVGAEQVQVLAVLPPDRQILATDLPREQRDALVARRRARHRHEIERAEVARPHQLGLDRRAVIGGVGAQPLDVAAVMLELDEPQILQPLRLRIGDREDDRSRQVRIAMAEDGDRPLGRLRLARRRPRRSRSRTAARARASAGSASVTIPSRKATEEMWPSPTDAQRHQDSRPTPRASRSGRNAAPRWGSSAPRRHSCTRGRNRRRSAGAWSSPIAAPSRSCAAATAS